MSSKVVRLDELLAKREQFRSEGKTVVFTNGCFDVLHIGHTRCLQEAKRLGDVLIVGLNSDASMRRLKGPGRPFMSQDDRAEILAALACVDYVAIFDEQTPKNLISLLKPDIHCKGGDYGQGKGKPMPEAEVVTGYGGRVEILSYAPGYSTTELIMRIVQRYTEVRGDQNG